jgi:hypothetical protein
MNNNKSLRSDIEDSYDAIDFEPLELDEKAHKGFLPSPHPIFVQPCQTAENRSDATDETLAEKSFREGNEALARGDRNGAIRSYRDAINYAPDKSQYYLKLLDLKLLDLLNSDSPSAAEIAEAEQLLNKAIAMLPNDQDLRFQLTAMRRLQEKAKDLAAQETIKTNKEAGQYQTLINPHFEPHFDIEYQPDGYALSMQTVNDSPAMTMEESADGRFWLPIGKAKKLPKRIKAANIIILLIISVITLCLFNFSHKLQQIEIKSISPQDQATLNKQQLQFHWSASQDNLDFIFQIEENGNKIIEHYTHENLYILSNEDLAQIKPQHRYHWIVMPVSAKHEALFYKPLEMEFSVVNNSAAPRGARE